MLITWKLSFRFLPCGFLLSFQVLWFSSVFGFCGLSPCYLDIFVKITMRWIFKPLWRFYLHVSESTPAAYQRHTSSILHHSHPSIHKFTDPSIQASIRASISPSELIDSKSHTYSLSSGIISSTTSYIHSHMVPLVYTSGLQNNQIHLIIKHSTPDSIYQLQCLCAFSCELCGISSVEKTEKIKSTHVSLITS